MERGVTFAVPAARPRRPGGQGPAASPSDKRRSAPRAQEDAPSRAKDAAAERTSTALGAQAPHPHTTPLAGMRACAQCGGTDIDIDAARGDAVCIQCGSVLEESTIVNEVTFAQDSSGAASVVGQFVAATPGIPCAGLGFSKESREVAFANGQRHISQLAVALRLADHHQDAAQRLFMLAVQHNFIQGRKTQHVIAACLYTVCRREKTAHLLIDYSDVLQTNVYSLGSCFLKFTRLLSLTLPIIDPSLYIHRFASKVRHAT